MKNLLILSYLPFILFSSEQILFPSHCTENSPSTGKKTRCYLEKYPNIYYEIFLPTNFKPNQKYGVIFEIPFGAFYHCVLGLGLSSGLDYILVTLPVLNSSGDKILDSFYPENIDPTIAFWLEILDDLDRVRKIV